MIRPPPRSTLFPHPPLSRSAGALERLTRQPLTVFGQAPRAVAWREKPSTYVVCAEDRATSPERSEEHTSELQSRQYLVCRLLLEKKRKTPSWRHDYPNLSRL